MNPALSTIDAAAEPSVTLGGEVESWLKGLASLGPGRPVVWRARGTQREGVTVRNTEHLSVFTSRLSGPGEWAIVDLDWVDGARGRWCQTMRHPAGWIVEAHDGSPDDFSKRVFRGSPGSYPQPTGRRPAYDLELWQPFAAAIVMMSWLCGVLPDGCLRTMRHMINRGCDHGLE